MSRKTAFAVAVLGIFVVAATSASARPSKRFSFELTRKSQGLPQKSALDSMFVARIGSPLGGVGRTGIVNYYNATYLGLGRTLGRGNGVGAYVTNYGRTFNDAPNRLPRLNSRSRRRRYCHSGRPRSGCPESMPSDGFAGTRAV